MEIGKKYKIILKEGTIYTAIIKSINETFIEAIDKNGVVVGINKESVSHYREISYEV